MTPTSINDLPIELHTCILKHLLTLSRKSLPIFHSPPATFEWKDKNTRSASLFPFNVTSAFKLWRDILALIPECWTRVVFDVAKDPTPLLDAFLWSGNLKDIEVFVFNSDNIETVDEVCEGAYVSAVAQALDPHIHRCKSIKFDVAYATSLPPSTMFFVHEAPYLNVLSLDCRIKHVGSFVSDIIPGNQPDLATSFPKLKELSLTGFWFMYLVLHARQSDWFDELLRKIGAVLSLSISHFAFPRHGHYSLEEFVAYLSQKSIYSIYLYDLSLTYAYDGSELEPEIYYGIYSNFHFSSVSKDFLAHLFAMTDVRSDDLLSFEACEIPPLDQERIEWRLSLANIIDDDECTSLRNILKVWSGCELTIHSCPSFNDTLLSWLASERKAHKYSEFDDDNDSHPTCSAKNIGSLKIIDCNNFSPRALREFIRVRNEVPVEDEIFYEESSMEDLHVSGTGPVLSNEDEKWFENKVNVYWEVRNGKGKKIVFRANKLLM